MNTPIRLFPMLCLVATVLPVHAQIPAHSEAIRVGELPDGAIAVKVENIRRGLKDGGQSGSLDMSRLVVAAQFQA
jgi:hypothetical protein